MKKLILIIAMALLLFTACTTEKPTINPNRSDYLELLIDKTEPVTTDSITYNQVVKFLPVLSDSTSNGATIHVSFITDYLNNPLMLTGISPEDPESVNEITRHKEIEEFGLNVKAVLAKASAFPSGREESFVFHSISVALERICTWGKDGQRTLVIYSDFSENSPEYRVYKRDVASDLRNDPHLILKQIHIKSSLEGIVIYMVHNPVSKLDDYNYTLISQAIKELLERAGAEVYLVTSIN